MERIGDIKRIVGKADACELLSCLFAFPDENLAQGLVEGVLADDAEACLHDAGADPSEAEKAASGLRAFADAPVHDVLSDLRRIYSRLYLAPGKSTPIFPYESAFLHVQRGLPGAPALFRTPITLDVERQMHEAGVAAKDERKEPCDSVFEEFEFLSYLYAKRAQSLAENDAEAEAKWGARIAAFECEHVLAWLPAFMERTRQLAAGTPYEAFAAVALCLLKAIAR